MSDVANALCQKRLRLMLAWPPLCAEKKVGEREEGVECSPAHHIRLPATLTPQPRSQEAVTFMPLPLFGEPGAVRADR